MDSTNEREANKNCDIDEAVKMAEQFHATLSSLSRKRKEEVEEAAILREEVRIQKEELDKQGIELIKLRATNSHLEKEVSTTNTISAELDLVIGLHNKVHAYAEEEYDRHQITKSERDDLKRRIEELQREHQSFLLERDELQEKLNGRQVRRGHE